MKRRDFLATGATLAIAAAGGCTGCAQAPTARLQMTETDDLAVAREVTYPLEDGGADRAELVESAVRNGSASIDATEPPFPEDRPFVYDGSIYQVSHEVADTRPARVFQFTLDIVDGEVAESERIRFEDLPAVDRAKFASRGWAEDPFIGFGSSLTYYEPEIPESALVPAPEHTVIEWASGARGRFSVDGSYDTEVKTYRYTSELVHPSARSFGREIRQRYEFTLSGLSIGEREIVAEAIENEHGWVVPPDESPPDAIYGLIERFGGHRSVRRVWEDDADRSAGPGGEYIVRYAGVRYWTRFGVDRDVLTESER